MLLVLWLLLLLVLGASTQELLADMYANASDEERRGLLEAAAKGAKKREQVGWQ
jgi:hypothetical protein